MIIDSSNNSVNSSAVSTAKTRAAATPGKEAKAEVPTEKTQGDSVSLSVKAQTMGRLQAQIGDAPEVDEAKVASIKAAIAEGRYQIDSQTVATRMLAQDDLLGQ